MWTLKRLSRQKKEENDAIKKERKSYGSKAAPKGKKYLGNMR